MNTVSHVRYWLAEDITRLADWFGGKVHVTPLRWLVVHWGGERDQRMITACTLCGEMLGSWKWWNQRCFGNCGPITHKRNVQLLNLLHSPFPNHWPSRSITPQSLNESKTVLQKQKFIQKVQKWGGVKPSKTSIITYIITKICNSLLRHWLFITPHIGLWAWALCWGDPWMYIQIQQYSSIQDKNSSFAQGMFPPQFCQLSQLHPPICVQDYCLSHR